MKNRQIEEIVLKNKIKEVKIDERHHFFLFVAMLIFFNLLLIASIWFVLLYLNSWYNWVICILFMGLAFGLSLREYRKVKHFHQCEIYENAIHINSIWFEISVELSNIFEMNIKETILDKIFKNNTKSLEFKILGSRRKNFTLHFIKEDVSALKQELTERINKYNENKYKTNLNQIEKETKLKTKNKK